MSDFDPRNLKPGDVIQWNDGDVIAAPNTVKCRKDDDTGWWLVDGSGLSDRAWKSGAWTRLTSEHIRARNAYHYAKERCWWLEQELDGARRSLSDAEDRLLMFNSEGAA